jgi:peroxiredoxin
MNIAAVTYDSVEDLKEAEQKHGVGFTLLHDEDVAIVNAFGVRNLNYEPGQRAYGIPDPGIFIIDADGVIQAKFAEESFRDRPDLGNVLEAINGM